MRIFRFLRDGIKKIFTVTDDKAEISMVSIIFVSLSEEEILFVLEPKDLIEALNEYINLVVNTIREFNGIIVMSSIPEEVSAIFTNKEHQKFACESAIEIIERFKKWKETSPLAKKIPSSNIATLNVAIGINTGKAIVARNKYVFSS